MHGRYRIIRPHDAEMVAAIAKHFTIFDNQDITLTRVNNSDE